MKNNVIDLRTAAKKAAEAEEDKEMDAAHDFAFDLFDKLGKEISKSEHCPDCVAYGLWVEFTRVLAMNGWTAKELKTDLAYHVRDQRKWDRENPEAQ